MILLTPRAIPCQQVVEMVTDYLEGDLSRRDRRRFEHHLAGCPHCSAYLAQMRATIQALGSVPVDSLSDEACDALLAAFRGRFP